MVDLNTDRIHVRILMGTYNGAQFLAEQLASFEQQTHKNWSLCVSDDGSDDQTLSILKGFRDRNPDREITLRRGPGKGVPSNYLSMISGLTDLGPGDVVALSDQDDVWFPDRLQAAVSALSATQARGAALYCANTILTGPDLSPIRQIRPRGEVTGFENALVQNVAAGNTIALNHDALRLLQNACPASDIPFHDWWIYLLVSGAGGEIIYDQEQRLFYRQHAHNSLGAHHGQANKLARLGLLLNGTYRNWLGQNAQALTGVSHLLAPSNRVKLESFRQSIGDSGLSRWKGVRASGVRRDTAVGSAAISLGALFGRV